MIARIALKTLIYETEFGHYNQCIEKTFNILNFKVLDDCVKSIVKEKQPFERLEMKKSDLLEMFKYNKFKVSVYLLIILST